MTHISLAQLTVADAQPVEFIEVAAGAGYQSVSLFIAAATFVGMPDYSLVRDAPLRRQVKAAIAATGVTATLGEGLAMRPEISADDFERGVDVMAELGIPLWNLVCWDPDLSRRTDNYLRLAEMAARRGVGVAIEFMGISHLRTLAEAVEIARAGPPGSIRLTLDSLHLYRCGSDAAEVAATPPELIAYAQIADGPQGTFDRDAYFEEAVFDRLPPGEGELPLIDYVRALPPGVIISPEVPMRARMQAALSTKDRAQLAIDATRKVLAAAGR